MSSTSPLTVRDGETFLVVPTPANIIVLSGLTSQPAMGAVCAALEQSGLGAGISHENIQALNTYWSQIRQLYQCFEANVRASDSGVFDHEMPGG